MGPDAVSDGIAMLAFEGRKGRRTAHTDILYFDISDDDTNDITIPLGPISIEKTTVKNSLTWHFLDFSFGLSTYNIRALLTSHKGTDKLTHTRGLELKNSCGDTIVTDR